ncbi:hypothetical protein [Rhizobium laguerreae]|uniref:hypothetical protein n=1 Tax=Rhizobium laguerreae TaxID=1076926 RepID=UPI001C916618|nr:hypothetical protein [Rhizobium laguerreae]MBY3222196.1 hypothetical protein [Rhizobium laguerreae]
MPDTKKKRLYNADDIIKGKRAMLDHLASLSGGEIIKGCCTQGCCGEITFDPSIMPEITIPPYSSQDLLNGKRAMLSTLAEISGGKLILGCCTQGCCDETALAISINVI